MTLRVFSVLLSAWLFFAFSNTHAAVAIPPLKAALTDLTHTLSPAEATQLTQQLTAFATEHGSQIAILMVPTTQPESIEQYSIRVAEAWQLGRKKVDDGILLLVAKNDRALRIETGYGLEGALPDALARRIIDEIIVPQFRQEHYFEGLQAGIQQIIKVIQGEALPPPVQTQQANLVLENVLPFLFIALILGRYFQAIFGKLAGATIAGTVAGGLIWLAFSSLAAAILIAVAVLVLNLFEQTGQILHRGGQRNWPPSGRGWPRGGSMGGGFRGGGGGFGGGGASGRW